MFKRESSGLNLILCLFIFASSAIAQQQTPQHIDSLFKVVIPQLRKQGDIPLALTEAEKGLKYASDIKYQDGIIRGYTLISNILNVMGKHNESLQNLDVISSLIEETENFELKAYANTEYGRNYMMLGLHQQAIISYDKARAAISSETNEMTAKRALNYLYGCEAALYEKIHDTVRFLNNLQSSYKLTPDPITASRLAKYYTTFDRKLDSAHYYLNIGDSLYKNGHFDLHQLAILLRNKGRFQYARGEWDKAINSYKQSLAISSKGKKFQDVRDTYKLLYEVYEKTNRSDSLQKYMRAYTVLNDSLQHVAINTVDIPVKKIIENERKSNSQKRSQLYMLIAAVVLISVLSFIYFKRELGKRKEQQQQALMESESEAKRLRQMVNESFEDVVILAKNNDPNFYARFQEIYPGIQRQLLSINPDLQNTELTLAAYIYLGFSTKDIADHTFKSIRTIQNRKYALRKRLDIESAEDIYVWFKNLGSAD